MNETDDKTTRRRTLAGLGAAGLGALIAACKKKFEPAKEDPYSRARAKPHVPGADRWATHQERWATTTCGQCPAGCGVRVRVVEGRAVRIEGNPENPLNAGGIGPRGLSGLQALYDPDRITGPMIRSGGRLEKASWDAALEAAAAAIKAAGGDLLVMSGRERGMTNDLLERLCRAAGGGRFIDGWPAHHGPIAEAMAATFGEGNRDLPAYDWGGARTVLSLEAGLLEDSCQAVYFARSAAERRGRQRARIVHVGAAFDLAAHGADEWIRARPGTGGALALAIAHVLVADGTFDPAALDGAQNRAAFEALIGRFDPESAAAITGIDAAAITELARELWSQQPSFAVIDDRSVDFSNAVETARAALALNVLLGAIEAPHGGVRLPIEAPLRSWPDVSGDLERLDDLGAALETLEARPPPVALLYYTNPVFSRARPQSWRAALSQVETVVSFSPYLDETTAEVADVVLPDHSYLERREDAGNAPGLPRAVVAVRQPVVEPLHDTRATGDVVLEIARRLGESVAAAMPWRRVSDAVDARLLGLHDAGRGTIRAKSEREFLEALYAESFWADAASPPPRPFEAELPATWSEPAWAGDETSFPLELLIYRPLGQTLGGSANQPWLQQLASRPGDRAWRRFARVHPDSAGPVADGQPAVITSEHGSIRMEIRHDRRVEPGVIAAPLGGGHTEFGRFAQSAGGANPMALLGADLLCGTRVKIEGAT